MLKSKKAILNYFFIAEFTDGYIYKQNQQDASVLFPPVKDDKGELQGKGCFTDVLELIKQGKKLRYFSLFGRGNQITVDLGTGLFHVNGLPLLLEGERLPKLPDKFDLVFYHQVDQKVAVTYDVKMKKAVKVESIDGDFREYFMGWQCTIKGKNYQQKIAVS